MGQQLFETLLKVISDNNANVRKAIAIALGDIDDSHAKTALAKMLNDKVWQVREEVIYSIGRANIVEAVPRLLEIIGCEDESGARKAILKWTAVKGEEQAPKKSQGGAGALTPGGKKPESDPWQVKKAAAITVSALRPDLAAEPLMKVLDVEEPQVRTAAMIGLGTIQAAEAIEPVMAMCEDKDWNIRKNAATTLGRLRAAEAASILIKLLGDEKFAVRIEAVIALNHIKPPEALEPLSKIVANDNSYEVRKTAATALGNYKNSDAAPALFEALKDDNWMVRKAAIEALTNLKVVDAIDTIVPYIGDEREDIRAAASISFIMLTKLAKGRV